MTKTPDLDASMGRVRPVSERIGELAHGTTATEAKVPVSTRRTRFAGLGGGGLTKAF